MAEKRKFVKKGELLVVYFSIFLILLSPYFFFGRLDFIPVLLFIIYFLKERNMSFPKKIIDKFILLFILILFAFWGSIVSVFYSTLQFQHLYVMSTFFLLYLSFLGLNAYVKKNGISIVHVSNAIVVTAVINSIIILFEFYFQGFRQLIEGLLLQFPATPYNSGMRYRGVASAGGAGLSIFNSVAFAIIMFKIREGSNYKFVFLAGAVLVFASTFFIGRTGLVIIVALTIFYSLRSFWIFVFMLTTTFIIINSVNLLQESLQDIYGEDMLWVSAGFLIDGIDWFKNEGTVETLKSFYFFPSGINSIIGYGFYGIGDFVPWTDSGYMRSVLSVGIPMALFIYLIIIKFTYAEISKNNLLLMLFLILIFSEYKEPLLFSGFASRSFLLLVAQRHYSNFIMSKTH